MCGLIAMIDHSVSKFNFQTKEEFFSMLLINSLRGAHSTGVLGVRKDQKAEFFKSIGTPWDMWGYKEYDTFVDRIYQKYTALLGHGRFSTRGATNAKNAHPHKRSHIHLIHNGTITNFDSLKKDYEGTNFEVDSDLCANMFAVEGVKETVKELIGSFAFIWYDQKLDAIRAIRNDDRPLWLFHRKMKDQYMLSSDPYIFDYMKSKYSMIGEAVQLVPGTLYTFNFENEKIEKEQLKLHTYTYQGQTYPPYTGMYSGDEWDMSAVANQRDFEDQDRCGVPWINPLPTSLPSTIPPARNPQVLMGMRKKALTGVTTSAFTIENSSWKVGATVRFVPNGAVDKPDKTTGEIHYILKGTVINSAKLEVTGIYSGDIMDIYDRGILTGVIENIVVLDSDPKFSARLFVKDIKPLEHGPSWIARGVPKTTDDEPTDKDKSYLTLGDDSKVARHRFDALARKRCGTCSGSISASDSDKTLILDEKIYCKDCVLKGEYPKNG